MRFTVLRQILLLAFVAAVLVGCGGDDTVIPEVNNPPEIEFTFVPMVVPAGEPGIILSVSVSDEDEDDDLTVIWEITRGTLAPAGDGLTASWDAPLTKGTDTVTMRVSDGEDSETITADIMVGTLISGNPQTQYLKSQSPYILRPTSSPPQLVIPAGFNANIEAGVEIWVDVAETIIDVAGNLSISGTPAEPVIIRPNDRTLFCGARRGWWEGILVGSEAGSGSDGFASIQHAEVWYGANGVRLRDGASATIRDSAIKCSQTGVLFDGSGTLIIEDTEISNSSSNGITIGRETQSTVPTSAEIRRCLIAINGNTGISMDLNDISRSVPITVEECKLEFNLVHGITLRRNVFPVIQHNHFASNGGGASNIRLLEDYPLGIDVPELDVTCNYWGFPVTNQSTIESTIFDRADDLDLGTRILVRPWLNEDPFGASQVPPCDGGTAATN